MKKHNSNFSSGLLFLQNSLYANSDVVITPKPIHLDNKMICGFIQNLKIFMKKLLKHVREF